MRGAVRQVRIVRTDRLIPRYPPSNSDQMTRPALAQPVAVPGMADRITLRAGRHPFFKEISSKTVMSSFASAKSSFSLAFSSSSCAKPLGLRHFQAAKLGLLVVERRLADPVTAANIHRHRTRLLSLPIQMIWSSLNLLRFIRPSL